MSFLDWFGQDEGGFPVDAPSPDEHHTLALYKYDACPFCQRVLRAVSRLEIDVEMRDTMREPRHRSDLRNKTGRTTVPCLYIDGEPMFESRDIVAWLEAYKEGALAG